VEDTRLVKVSFRAYASLLNGLDALPGDNEFISFPVKVTGKAGIVLSTRPVELLCIWLVNLL